MPELREDHRLDPDGNPAGGFTLGTGIDIKWQDGPIDDGQQSGAQVEDVIEACMGRLQFLQKAADGKFACQENREALHYLHYAVRELQDRTFRRKKRGVEGKAIP